MSYYEGLKATVTPPLRHAEAVAEMRARLEAKFPGIQLTFLPAKDSYGTLSVIPSPAMVANPATEGERAEDVWPSDVPTAYLLVEQELSPWGTWY